ncbi:MAG: serine/threonine-protein kinase [Byssovorax sp.]
MPTESEKADRMSAASPSARESKRDLGGDDCPRPLGRYLLLKRIARGGMGEVFLASTTGLEGAERPVVVKIIRREHAKDPSFIARFLDEARVQAQLQHSGVAQVIDAALDDQSGEPYAVVEFVEGRSLGDLRSRAVQMGRTIRWADAAALSCLIAEALGYVHERKDASGRDLAIVHRDLSPQNVMVSYTGDAKIIDFGTARGQNRRCHTVAGVVFAKPGYVAPEVANGDSGDARVDLYALGIMLWELCAGRRFLQGDAGVHMAAVARNEKNPPPIAAEAGAPAELDAIIQKLTAFDRDTRYSEGRAVATDLARVLASAPPLQSGERGVRARVAELMRALFPGEPGKSRQEFARLVAENRVTRASRPAPSASPKSEPPAEAPKDDGLLAGTRYKILREIGRGSSSVVYEAEHVDLGRKAALKVLAADNSRADDVSERFRREARVLSTLSHEGLVEVSDFGLAADGRLFCGMELLSGETLEAYLGREKGIDWREALGFCDKALAALEVAHAAGIVHRDLKPGNLFLTEGGLKILDFGLAKTVDEAGLPHAGFTIFGTPEYMAPEQAAAGQVDARADVYALGCVLYEMLTGRLPFVGASAVAILDSKTKGSPEHPRAVAPARGIPEAVDALVMRALARHPSVRFQSAAEMRKEIAVALSAPARRRAALRRGVGLASAVALLSIAVAVGALRGKQIRASVSKLHLPWRAPVTAEIAAAPAALPAAPPAAEPAPPPATPPAAVPAEDPALAQEAAEDAAFEFVDDTLPPAGETVAASASDPAPPSEPAAAPEPPVPLKGKHAKKHGDHGSKKVAQGASKPAGKGQAPADAKGGAPGAGPSEELAPKDRSEKAGKSRHKKKTRMAKAAP